MRIFTPAAIALALAACNQNTSPGADREAQVDPAPAPAPQMGAAEALDGIATEAIAVETMTDVDIASLGDLAGNCRFLTTEVAKPSLAFAIGAHATIKLNGTLVALPSTGERSYADGGLEVRLRPVEGSGDAGLPEEEMIVMLPGAKDELGYRGYRQCIGEGGARA